MSLTIPVWAQRGFVGQAHVSARATSDTRLGSSHVAGSTHISTIARAEASERTNKHGKVRGRERAEAAQSMNTSADANRGYTVAPGVEGAEAGSSEETSEHTAAKAGKHASAKAGGKQEASSRVAAEERSKLHDQ